MEHIKAGRSGQDSGQAGLPGKAAFQPLKLFGPGARGLDRFHTRPQNQGDKGNTANPQHHT